MAKKQKTQKKKATVQIRKKSKKANVSARPRGARVKPNGPMELAEEPTPIVALGTISIPSPDDSARVLMDLAVLNDRALVAQRVYSDLKDRTKTAKEKYDELAEQVLTRLRQATHVSDLPLFSQADREVDQTRMEAGPEVEPEGPEGAAEAPDGPPNEVIGSGEPEIAPVEDIQF